jgi:hypothetical protein
MRHISHYNLWLGHVGDISDLSAIHAAGIKVLVDLAMNESPAKLSRDLAYCRFPLIDASGNPQWMLRAAINTVVFLLHSGIPTLVYCGAGMSRSPTIVGAAISKIQKCPLADGLAVALQSGTADISPGFLADVQAAIE